MGWTSGDREVMLGLPDHLCLWGGAIPREEVASRETLAGGPVP